MQTWGEDGYFKMVWDFTDEFNVTHSSCGVGKGVVAGLPDLSKYKTMNQGRGEHTSPVAQNVRLGLQNESLNHRSFLDRPP